MEAGAVTSIVRVTAAAALPVSPSKSARPDGQSGRKETRADRQPQKWHRLTHFFSSCSPPNPLTFPQASHFIMAAQGGINVAIVGKLY